MRTAFTARRTALQELLTSREPALDALLVTHPANIFYLTGFTGDSGALLMSRSGAVLMTDGRFTVQAREETAGVRIVLQKGGLFDSLGQLVKVGPDNRIGFDPTQLTVSKLSALRKAAGTWRKWVATSGLVETLRAIKEPAELVVMRRAVLLAGNVVNEAVTHLKVGVREQEVAAHIEFAMRRGGASGAAFESIVAFGPRAALPHARATGKRLRKNELVVLDLGAILQNYCSDITRTFFCGKAPARVKLWYKATLEAQQAAIATVKAGVTCGEVDAAARQVLAGYGLDKYFVHSTGHGLGLEVHEDPRLARAEKRRLEAGMVVTIEPGVYIPGVGGIRIEDDVAVHAKHTEVLTRIPRDLIEL